MDTAGAEPRGEPPAVLPRRLVVLGLGSNLGDREGELRRAIGVLAARLGPVRVAPLYRSPAAGDPGGPDFLNTAAAVTTDLAAEDLLALAKRLELASGRRRTRRWAARSLDVDLLVDTERTCDLPELHLPHPRLRERGFALVPLAHLVPDLPLPPDGRTAAELAAALPPGERPEEIAWSQPPPT